MNRLKVKTLRINPDTTKFYNLAGLVHEAEDPVLKYTEKAGGVINRVLRSRFISHYGALTENAVTEGLNRIQWNGELNDLDAVESGNVAHYILQHSWQVHLLKSSDEGALFTFILQLVDISDRDIVTTSVRMFIDVIYESVEY